MAGKVLCEATKLYNILNQYTHLPRLAESNYLCLIDTRAAESYNLSHIITARNAKWDFDGKFIMPMDVEIDSMRYIIVYDSNTHSLLDSGPAIDCADCLEKASRFPVQILNGGYEKFSALYPFLRTQKILYSIRELESLNPYPVEILLGQLYMGDYRQATNPQILKDLKLNALVNVSDECSLMFKKANCTVLHVRIADSPEANLATSFERMCVFIGSHINTASSVLIFSTLGRSRCCAVAMAYLMHHLKYTLKVFQTCMNFFLLLNSKDDILKNMGNQTVVGAPLTSIVWKKILWKSLGPINCLVTDILQNIFFNFREAWNHIEQCKANMRPNRGFVQQLSDWELHTVGTRVTDISEPNY